MGIDCDTCQSFSSTSVPKPDFIVLGDDGIPNSTSTTVSWLVVETETRIRDAGEVLRQVTAGAQTVLTDKRFSALGRPFQLRGVILHSRGCHVGQVEIILQQGIKIGGTRYPVQVLTAGGKGVVLTVEQGNLSIRRR